MIEEIKSFGDVPYQQIRREPIIRLNLACGPKPLVGFINVDFVPLPGVDYLFDLSTFPWPWADNSVDYVYTTHYLEHAKDILATLEEIYRIMKPGARLYIEVPYATGWTWQRNLTHINHFCYSSFGDWINNPARERLSNYGLQMRWDILHREILFFWDSNWVKGFINWLTWPVFNLFPELYERALMPILPASIIRYELKKPL
jgi:SAM-dependent methyltransferase